MRVLVQRSGKAQVSVSGEVVGSIDSGLVLLVGFSNDDSLDTVCQLAKKVLNLRIFPDSNGVMNKSILEYGGSILSVSQFTLYGNCSKGNRPSYLHAMKGEAALSFYEAFNKELSKHVLVQTGKFGHEMEVFLTNLGPTTIWLER